MKQTSGLLLVVMRSNVSLKSCLGNLISSNQTAFVTGRNISERLPTHGIVKHYQRNKGKARCASKVDFKKAYDSKEWTTSKGAIPQIKEGSLRNYHLQVDCSSSNLSYIVFKNDLVQHIRTP